MHILLSSVVPWCASNPQPYFGTISGVLNQNTGRPVFVLLMLRQFHLVSVAVFFFFPLFISTHFSCYVGVSLLVVLLFPLCFFYVSSADVLVLQIYLAIQKKKKKQQQNDFLRLWQGSLIQRLCLILNSLNFVRTYSSVNYWQNKEKSCRQTKL